MSAFPQVRLFQLEEDEDVAVVGACTASADDRGANCATGRGHDAGSIAIVEDVPVLRLAGVLLNLLPSSWSTMSLSGFPFHSSGAVKNMQPTMSQRSGSSRSRRHAA